MTAAAVTLWVMGGAPPPLVLWITLVFYILSVLGITVGYHRLFTHRAFQASPFAKRLLGALGSMAAQGGVIFWVTEHRKHHQNSDRKGDPHSPHLRQGRFAKLRGLLYAHFGWMTGYEFDAKEWASLGRDLLMDKQVRSIDAQYPLWLGVGIILPALLGGAIGGSLRMALLGGLWGGFVRIFLVHQATWSVNSVCHVFGARPFMTDDESRNNGVVAFVALGEGWHNNHHAFPTSARHGLKWHEIDPSWWTIRLFQCLGWVQDVKTPSLQQLKKKEAENGKL
jgi:stearoyl-CoA desaturase (delta-9 desaturase)